MHSVHNNNPSKHNQNKHTSNSQTLAHKISKSAEFSTIAQHNHISRQRQKIKTLTFDQYLGLHSMRGHYYCTNVKRENQWKQQVPLEVKHHPSRIRMVSECVRSPKFLIKAHHDYDCEKKSLWNWCRIWCRWVLMKNASEKSKRRKPWFKRLNGSYAVASRLSPSPNHILIPLKKIN